MKNLIISVLVFIFLTGCGVPLYNSVPQFTSYAPDSNLSKGNIVFSSFDVPQEDGEILRKFIFGQPQNMSASIYDVTNGLNYVGTLTIRKLEGLDGKAFEFIEYNSPLGKRIFMLTFPAFPKPLALDNTDFIEVNVTANRTIHVGVAPYGFRQMPYFTELVLEDNHFAYCSELTGKYGDRKDKIEQYMKQNQISINARYFLGYCLDLCDVFKKVIVPNKEAYAEFEKHKVEVEKIKDKNLPEWENTKVRKAPFNLLKSYEESKSEENK